MFGGKLEKETIVGAPPGSITDTKLLETELFESHRSNPTDFDPSTTLVSRFEN